MYEYTFGELEGALVSRHLHISYMIVHGSCCHADESSRTKRSIEKVPTILLDCSKNAALLDESQQLRALPVTGLVTWLKAHERSEVLSATYWI